MTARCLDGLFAFEAVLQIFVTIFRHGRPPELAERGIVDKGPAREIFDLGREIQLAERQGTVGVVFLCQGAFENERLQVGNGRRKSRRSSPRGQSR